MSLIIDRRSLLITGALGLGGLAIPGFARTPNVTALRGFTHSVASGEPASDSMLLWTRYVPTGGGAAGLRVEVSETPDFAKIVAGGAGITGPWRDHTAKITVGGLRPARSYHYRFIAPDGGLSPVGRTRTLPEGDAARFSVAIFSCSNLPFGYFNAYGHAAARGDIDLAIHLGDYLYEYPAGEYPGPKKIVAGRAHQPANELIHLADYRLRYASYRADPDLQRLHAAMPMIVQRDDHEAANNSWEGGAENNQPGEGDWSIRRGASIQAFQEWLPMSEEPWKAYDIGTLATLYRTETRLIGRTEPPEMARLFAEPDPVKALIAFRDGRWMDPAATMMGSQQENWLAHAMRRSVKAGARWQVAGFGTIMGERRTPSDALSWLSPDAPAGTRRRLTMGIAAARLGLPQGFDTWSGYPAARARFLRSAQALDASLVVLSGDSHNAWAYDLAQDGNPAGVEFAGQSVTSQGFEANAAVDPRTIAASQVAANRELKWCDMSHRGYMVTTLTPDHVANDWIGMATIRQRSAAARVIHTARVARGRNVMA